MSKARAGFQIIACLLCLTFQAYAKPKIIGEPSYQDKAKYFSQQAKPLAKRAVLSMASRISQIDEVREIVKLKALQAQESISQQAIINLITFVNGLPEDSPFKHMFDPSVEAAHFQTAPATQSTSDYINSFIAYYGLQGAMAQRAVAIGVAIENDLSGIPDTVMPGEINGYIALLEQKRSKYISELSAANDRVAVLTSEIQVLESQITTKRGQITALQNEISAAAAEIERLGAELQTINVQLTILIEERAAIASINPNDPSLLIFDSVISSLQTRVNEKNNRIALLRAQNSVKEAQITQLRADIAALQQQIDVRTAEREMLQRVDIPIKTFIVQLLGKTIELLRHAVEAVNTQINQAVQNMLNSAGSMQQLSTLMSQTQQAMDGLLREVDLIEAYLEDATDPEMVEEIFRRFEDTVVARVVESLVNQYGIRPGAEAAYLTALVASMNQELIYSPSGWQYRSGPAHLAVAEARINIKSAQRRLLNSKSCDRVKNSARKSRCQAKQIKKWNRTKKLVSKVRKEIEGQIDGLLSQASAELPGGLSIGDKINTARSMAESIGAVN